MRLIHRSLTAYEGGQVDLARVVSDVESLIDSLEEVADASWVGALGHEWLDLEIVNAVGLDEGRSALTSTEQHDVDGAVARLRSLLDRRENSID